MPSSPSRPDGKDIQKAFGRAVRQRRGELEISQEELGFRSGLDRSYVGGVERGERNIAVVNIVIVAKALDLTAAELLRRSGL